MTTSNVSFELKLTAELVDLVKTYIVGYETIEASKTTLLEFVRTWRTSFSIIRKNRFQSPVSMDIYKAFRSINIVLVKYERLAGYRN